MKELNGPDDDRGGQIVCTDGKEKENAENSFL
jgi:hypothetical protein